MTEPRPPIHPAPDDWPETRDYHRDQADEIARLRARVKELEAALRRAHRLMRQCGWQLAPASYDMADEEFAHELAEAEEDARAVLAKGETP